MVQLNDKSMPLIEILMATYNGERFLTEQLDSIINQSYSNWLLRISDDCSSDGTAEIIDAYQSADSRIEEVTSGRRFGAAAEHFYWLAQRSAADYVAFSDQDDVWISDKLSIQMEKMRALEDEFGRDVPLLVHSDLEVVDVSLSTICDSYADMQRIKLDRVSFNQLIPQNVVTGCTVLANRSLIAMLEKGFDPSILMHDRWLALLAAAFGHVGTVEAPLVRYRQHGSNAVGAHGFSISSRIFKLDKAAQSMRDTGKQAALFERRYSGRLSEEKRSQVHEYALAFKEPFLATRLSHFLKSGCWMSGISRKIAQIVALVFCFPMGEAKK